MNATLLMANDTLLNEINIARTTCERAFAAQPDTKYIWCCHHEILAEVLYEPVANRISFITANKLAGQQVTRFNNFRPMIVNEENEALITQVMAEAEVHKISFNDEINVLYTKFEKDSSSVKYQTALILKFSAAKTELLKRYHDGYIIITAKLLPLYKQQVPNGTWDGQSIFPKP